MLRNLASWCSYRVNPRAVSRLAIHSVLYANTVHAINPYQNSCIPPYSTMVVPGAACRIQILDIILRGKMETRPTLRSANAVLVSQLEIAPEGGKIPILFTG